MLGIHEIDVCNVMIRMIQVVDDFFMFSSFGVKLFENFFELPKIWKTKKLGH